MGRQPIEEVLRCVRVMVSVKGSGLSATHLVHVLVSAVSWLRLVIVGGGVAGLLASAPQPLAASELAHAASHQGKGCGIGKVNIINDSGSGGREGGVLFLHIY